MDAKRKLEKVIDKFLATYEYDEEVKTEEVVECILSKLPELVEMDEIELESVIFAKSYHDISESKELAKAISQAKGIIKIKEAKDEKTEKRG